MKNAESHRHQPAAMLNAASESMPRSVDLEAHLVQIGGRTGDELLDDLVSAGIRLNEYAKALLASGKFQTAEKPRGIAVVVVSVGDLGLPEGEGIQAIYKSALDRQLALCPIEVAPHFRLQYRDQPEGCVGHASTQAMAPPGSITVSCEPIDSDGSFPKGFYLRRIEGELWLRGYRCDDEHIWDSHDRFAFRKKLSSLDSGKS